jgi:glucokinase
VVEAAESSVLAIDLGGTQIRAAYVTPDLAVLHRAAVPTDDERGVDVVVGAICELAGQVRDAARDAGLPPPIGACISSPGPLDPWRGVVVAPPNLRGWHDVPLADRVQRALGMPTFLERDTNVAVLSEWRYGAARGTRDAIYITVSTGIGGGIILAGQPFHGADGTAGEVGHVTVELDGPLCGDGQRGHVEAIASGAGIARAAREALAAGRAPGLARLVAGGAEPDAAAVGHAADEGDADCRAILDHAWEALGALCAGLVNLLNPEVIVVGGSIAEHRPELFDRIRAAIGRRAFAIPARRVRIEPAAHTDDVSLIGALPIVHERLTDPAYRRGTPIAAQAATGSPSERSTTP